MTLCLGSVSALHRHAEDAWQAWVSYLNYGKDGLNIPGIFHSPAGPYAFRLHLFYAVGAAITLSFGAMPVPFLGVSMFDPVTIALLSLLCVVPAPDLRRRSRVDSRPTPRQPRGGSAVSPNFERALALRNSHNATERQSLLLGTLLADGSPLLAHVKSFANHLYIRGSPGSGKSAMLAFLCELLLSLGRVPDARVST